MKLTLEQIGLLQKLTNEKNCGLRIVYFRGNNLFYGKFVDGPDANGISVVKRVYDENFVFVLHSDLLIEPLFWCENKPVYKNDILYHPNTPATGSKLKAEFYQDVFEDVVVMRTENGAAPTVDIKNLSWNPPKVKKSGWINLHNTIAGISINGPFESEEIALFHKQKDYIDTIEIHWEE